MVQVRLEIVITFSFLQVVLIIVDSSLPLSLLGSLDCVAFDFAEQVDLPVLATGALGQQAFPVVAKVLMNVRSVCEVHLLLIVLCFTLKR
jgi:hypothetical protein